jgi:hypothetical protein
MDTAQTVAGQQFKALAAVPGATLTYWPAFLTFTAVEYGEAMLISAIPPVSGTAGMVLNSLLRGMTRVAQMVTWDLVKIYPYDGASSTSSSGSSVSKSVV